MTSYGAGKGTARGTELGRWGVRSSFECTLEVWLGRREKEEFRWF